MVVIGSVVFIYEDESEDAVHAAQERIQKAVESECPDLICNVTEDIWDED